MADGSTGSAERQIERCHHAHHKDLKADTLVHHGRRAIRGDRFLKVTSDAHGMGSKGSSEYRARQGERERRRRRQQDRSAVDPAVASGAQHHRGAALSGSARRAAATTCGWCNGPITPRASGPIPKWCSSTCRKRAWEQARAAASGRSAIRIVARAVIVPAQRPATGSLPRQYGWVHALRELGVQLAPGVVYDRHLVAIATALDEVVRAVHRRARPQG